MQIADGGDDEENRLKAELRTCLCAGYSDVNEHPAGPNTWPSVSAGVKVS